MGDVMARVQSAKVDAVMGAITAPTDVTTVTTFEVAEGSRNAFGDQLLAVRLVVTRHAPDADNPAGCTEVKAEELTRATRRHAAGWHPLPAEVAQALAFRALSF